MSLINIVYRLPCHTGSVESTHFDALVLAVALSSLGSSTRVSRAGGAGGGSQAFGR